MGSYSSWVVGTDYCEVRRTPRPDLYNLLPREIIEQDQQSGHMTYLDFWDDPEESGVSLWDEAGAIWDRTGYKPVLESLFWVMENESKEDLIELENLEDLRDPDRCPVEFLPIWARSLGHALEEGLSEKAQRETLQAIVPLNKIRGKPISYVIFYRMLGYRISAWPLWKKAVHEAQDRYARTRFDSVSAVSGETLTTIPVGTLASPPVRPTSLRITDGVETFRDDGKGGLIGNQGGTGSIIYATGAYRVNFATPPAGAVSADYDHVDDEYPYHAARIDLDVFLVPIGGGPPAVVDATFVKNILDRLDEVNPIHVLVRAFSFIYEDSDTVSDFARDGAGCGPEMVEDFWDGGQDFYVGDLGIEGEDGYLQISRSDGFEEIVLDDLAPLVCPASDTMTITSTPAQPHDGVW